MSSPRRSCCSRINAKSLWNQHGVDAPRPRNYILSAVIQKPQKHLGSISSISHDLYHPIIFKDFQKISIKETKVVCSNSPKSQTKARPSLYSPYHKNTWTQICTCLKIDTYSCNHDMPQGYWTIHRLLANGVFWEWLLTLHYLKTSSTLAT